MLEWKFLDLAVFFSTAQLIWSRRTDAILFTLGCSTQGYN